MDGIQYNAAVFERAKSLEYAADEIRYMAHALFDSGNERGGEKLYKLSEWVWEVSKGVIDDHVKHNQHTFDRSQRETSEMLGLAFKALLRVPEPLTGKEQ
jgi:hypothetical protein